MNAFAWWSETPDASQTRIWCYTDKMTYSGGDTVQLHVSGTCSSYTFRVTREGAEQQLLHSGSADNCRWTETPADSYAQGCGWPVLYSFKVPEGAPAGAYLIEVMGEGCAFAYHHLIFLKQNNSDKAGRLLLIAATNTYAAYNNWGGASHYGGLGDDGSEPAFVVSNQRPWGRGTICLPAGSPRIPDFRPRYKEAVRYPHLEWAREHGYTRSFAAAGWANYERIFVEWAEREGFAVDIVCQHTLHDDPDCLSGYSCVACVGHDEYWTWEMRDAIDRYVESGGNVARFAGNFMWQTRLDTAAQQQTTYKYSAREMDPLFGSDQQRFTTTCWEAKEVARPGSLTFGVNATRGMYAGWGGVVSHGPRAFTVYRPQHWIFAGTGLGYGDSLGAEGRCFGYEVDGLDYVIEGGLPRPSGKEAVPDNLVIVALGLSTSVETGSDTDQLYIGDLDGVFLTDLYAELDGETAGAAAVRGCGTIVEFTRGAGRVVTIGSCEWVAGLLRQDDAAQQVTRNILTRLIG